MFKLMAKVYYFTKEMIILMDIDPGGYFSTYVFAASFRDSYFLSMPEGCFIDATIFHNHN
ncbi:MAG TPA: hypothetical protein VF941_21725 [Clostridia bacterium]